MNNAAETKMQANLIEDDTNTVQLAHLLFRIFIYVTDTDKEITPYEVQRFNRLLEDPKWTNNKELRRALGQLRQDYSSLWASYESKSLDFNLEVISAQLESTWFARTSNIADLRRSLRDFVAKIGQTGSPALARLGLVGAAVSKTNARIRIEGLLAAGDEAVPAAATQEALTKPAEDKSSAARWPAAHLTLASQQIWHGGRTKVRCVNVTAETADVKTYSFAAVPERMFDYRPGQYISIELVIGGRTVRRNYTISSSPTRPHLLSITVKRVPDGLVSNWLYDNMVDGVECFISGPAGDFSCLNHPSEKLLMISGGSGVTPMMSMLRWMSDVLPPVDIVFINNVRTPSDVIFERELQLISARLRSKLRLAVVPGLLSSGQGWNGLTGPMNDHMLQTFAPDFLEREVFLCGPTGYMDMVKNMLKDLGFPSERLHQENFAATPALVGRAPPPAEARVADLVSAGTAPTGLAPAGLAPAGPATAGVRQTAAVPARALARETAPAKQAVRSRAASAPAVFLEQSGQSFTCDEGETILDAAERQGLKLPSLCRVGVCGTCKVRKTSGTVTMEEQKILSQAEIDEGLVLPCISHAEGRVALDA
jgi:ferredoxin-NADP reductase